MDTSLTFSTNACGTWSNPEYRVSLFCCSIACRAMKEEKIIVSSFEKDEGRICQNGVTSDQHLHYPYNTRPKIDSISIHSEPTQDT